MLSTGTGVSGRVVGRLGRSARLPTAKGDVGLDIGSCDCSAVGRKSGIGASGCTGSRLFGDNSKPGMG